MGGVGELGEQGGGNGAQEPMQGEKGHWCLHPLATASLGRVWGQMGWAVKGGLGQTLLQGGARGRGGAATGSEPRRRSRVLRLQLHWGRRGWLWCGWVQGRGTGWHDPGVVRVLHRIPNTHACARARTRMCGLVWPGHQRTMRRWPWTEGDMVGHVGTCADPGQPKLIASWGSQDP